MKFYVTCFDKTYLTW